MWVWFKVIDLIGSSSVPKITSLELARTTFTIKWLNLYSVDKLIYINMDLNQVSWNHLVLIKNLITVINQQSSNLEGLKYQITLSQYASASIIFISLNILKSLNLWSSLISISSLTPWIINCEIVSTNKDPLLLF